MASASCTADACESKPRTQTCVHLAVGRTDHPSIPKESPDSPTDESTGSAPEEETLCAEDRQSIIEIAKVLDDDSKARACSERRKSSIKAKTALRSDSFPRANSILSSDAPGKDSSRQDWSAFLSAEVVEEAGHGDEHATYPVLLLICVCVLAMVSGLIVSGFHYVIKYSGCPLGISGCHDSPKGFFLIKAVRDFSDGSVPEDLVCIICAVIGACFISALYCRLPADICYQIQSGGTAQSLISVARGKPIRLKCAILRIVVSALYLGLGGTLGAEGAAIQVCTALAGSIGWSLGMRAPATQSLLSTLGFASGFAASFNSPMAGIIFAMEELGHVTEFVSQNIIIVILLASVTATAASRATHEKWQLLEPNWETDILTSSDGGSIDKVFGQSCWMLIAAPIGVACSFLGWAITRGISRLYVELQTRKNRVPRCLHLVMATFLSACLGSICFRATGLRGVWGIGAESMQQAFDSDFHGWEYVVFVVCKATAMVISVAARAPGDVLEPILISGGFLGATFGYLFKLVVHDPELDQLIGKPCIVFGMVGLFSSCFRFPLTPVVITLEVMGIDTYALVLPTVLCSFMAITVSNRLFPRPLLEDMLSQEGVDLRALAKRAVMNELAYEEEQAELDALAGHPPTTVEPLEKSLDDVVTSPGKGTPAGGVSACTLVIPTGLNHEVLSSCGTTPAAHSPCASRRWSLVHGSASFFGEMVEQSMLRLAKKVEVTQPSDSDSSGSDDEKDNEAEGKNGQHGRVLFRNQVFPHSDRLSKHSAISRRTSVQPHVRRGSSDQHRSGSRSPAVPTKKFPGIPSQVVTLARPARDPIFVSTNSARVTSSACSNTDTSHIPSTTQLQVPPGEVSACVPGVQAEPFGSDSMTRKADHLGNGATPTRGHMHAMAARSFLT
mmetsp:Transcript_15885/g.43516  ORF Transcript_15885/g.43516 Transcript_15885/m.43516 type:complete len:901 (-) Transcript_15885:199-2901(-)